MPTGWLFEFRLPRDWMKRRTTNPFLLSCQARASLHSLFSACQPRPWPSSSRVFRLRRGMSQELRALREQPEASTFQLQTVWSELASLPESVLPVSFVPEPVALATVLPALEEELPVLPERECWLLGRGSPRALELPLPAPIPCSALC